MNATEFLCIKMKSVQLEYLADNVEIGSWCEWLCVSKNPVNMLLVLEFQLLLIKTSTQFRTSDIPLGLNTNCFKAPGYFLNSKLLGPCYNKICLQALFFISSNRI
jgi:hypothetical protein